MDPRHPVAAFDAGASCGAVASASYPCLDSLDPSRFFSKYLMIISIAYELYNYAIITA